MVVFKLNGESLTDAINIVGKIGYLGKKLDSKSPTVHKMKFDVYRIRGNKRVGSEGRSPGFQYQLCHTLLYGHEHVTLHLCVSGHPAVKLV